MKTIELLKHVYSFVRLIRKENLKNYFPQIIAHTPAKHSDLTVLANGPSLGEVLKNIKDYHFENTDVCVVNYLATDDSFTYLKPSLYTLSDEQFFIPNHPRSKMAEDMLEAMNNKVTWPMTVLIPFHYWKTGVLQRKLSNENIKVLPFHHYSILGSENVRFKYFKKGLGNGEFGTVVQNSIYCGITMGYKTIHLYGVDHNFFDGLSLDGNNHLRQLDTHYYDNGEVKYRMILNIDGSHIPVHKFLSDYALLFYGHSFLQRYADYAGTKILNHTKNSLIDAYEKA